MKQARLWCSLAAGLLFPLCASAQAGGSNSFLKYPDFRGDTLIVVTDENEPDYSEAVQKSIESYWKLSPFRFMGIEDLKPLMKSEAYAFLIRDNTMKEFQRVDRVDVVQRNHLAIYLSGLGSDLRAYGGKNALAQFQFADVSLTPSYLYKLPALLRAMQSYLAFVDSTKLTEDNYKKKLLAFQTAGVSQLKGATLLMVAEELPEALRDSAALAKAYPLPFRLSDREALAAAIASEQAGAAFLHFEPEYEAFYVISSRGEIWYYGSPAQRKTFTSAELQALAKAAQAQPKSSPIPLPKKKKEKKKK
jgi:hypothetical protein